MRIKGIIIFLAFQVICHAQVDSILLLPPEEQHEAIFHIYHSYFNQPAERIRIMEPLQNAFQDAKRDDLAEMIWSLLWVDHYNLMTIHNFESDKQFFTARIAEAQKKKWKRGEEEMKFGMGHIYFLNQRIGEGVEIMLNSHDYLTLHGWSSKLIRANRLRDLSKIFYEFGDYQTCIHYLQESFTDGLPSTSIGYPYYEFNTIGLCYLKLHNPDSAIQYFKQSYDQATVRQDSGWMALTSGNIGHAYVKANQPEEAIPFLEKDYKESIRLGETGSAVNAASLLAHIELQKGNLQQAEEYIAFATSNIGPFPDQRLSIYENLFLYYRLKQDDHLAAQYADSVIALKRLKDIELDRNILEQAKMKAAYLEYTTQITKLKAARSRQVVLRNSAFVVLILLSMMGYILIRRTQKRKTEALRKLGEAETELRSYIQSLLEKNEVIQSLRNTIEKGEEKSAMDRSEEIAQLIQLNILTEDDWKQFRKLFDVVHPGFLVRLKEKFEDLTPAETRLLVLTKLQIPQKEMSGMLGISYDSIRKSRYRLRKKLNLPEEGSLEELVSLI